MMGIRPQPEKTMKEWKLYERRVTALEMRPFDPSTDDVNLIHNDGTPAKVGDMIARNPNNHDDEWLMPHDYFATMFDTMPIDEDGKLNPPTYDDSMDFGEAIEALKIGHKVARAGWNGKGMCLVYVAGSHVKLKEGTPYYKALNGRNFGSRMVDINPHIDMLTATGEMQPGWLASQTDMLAHDWCVVD